MFTRVLQAIISLSAALASFSILGTALYYVMPVSTAGLVICAALGVIVGYIVGYEVGIKADPIPQPTKITHPITHGLLFFLALTSLALWWSAVLSHPITESVRSPWLVISPGNLLWLFFPVLCTIILLVRKSYPIAFLVIVLTLFSALSFAAAAYPLGYGFDPFLHRATVEHIAEHGTITPKPLYYIGQYVIELFAVKAFHLPLKIVDAFLVPLLAAILIPAAVFLRAARTGGASPALTATMLLFLPFAAFVQTTPQALAFVFTTLTVLLGSPSFGEGARGRAHMAYPAIFAFAALCAHPLAGLPAIFFVAMTYASTWRAGQRPAPTAVAIIGILSAITLPLAFIAQSLKAGLPLGLHLPTLHDISTLPLSLFLGTHFNAWGDTAYFIIGNFFFITVALGILGVWRMSHESVIDRPLQRFIPLICAGIAFLNFLMLGLLFDFPFLISYERSDFTARMLTLTVLFLLPYIPHAFAPLTAESETRPYSTYAFATMMIGMVFVASVYGAYPRHDAYARSAGFNVTQTDIDAVQRMEAYANGQDYVVLGNQALSGAAIETLGFKKYYHGDIFFYPIPTGGALYELYLEMAKTPTLTTIKKARELTGAKLVFFVMHDYWWDSERVREQTRTIADDMWTLPGGTVTVMLFGAAE